MAVFFLALLRRRTHVPLCWIPSRDRRSNLVTLARFDFPFFSPLACLGRVSNFNARRGFFAKTPNFHAIGPRLTSMRRGEVPFFDFLMKIVRGAEKFSRIQILGNHRRDLQEEKTTGEGRGVWLCFPLLRGDFAQCLSRIVRCNELVVFRPWDHALKSSRDLFIATHSCFHLVAGIVWAISTVVQASVNDARTNRAVFFWKIRAAARS